MRDALQKGDSDEVILQSFVEKYAADVLDRSMTTANKLVWVVVFAALTSIAIALVRKRRSRPAIAAMPLAELHDVDVDALHQRVREETEKDDYY